PKPPDPAGLFVGAGAADSRGGARESFEDVRVSVAARRGARPDRGVCRQKELTGLLTVVRPLRSLTGTSTKLPHADPSRELGSAAVESLLLTCSAWSPAGE